MTRPRIAHALCALLVATVMTSAAHAEDLLTWYSWDGGGVAFATAGPYRLGGTIGQHDAGRHAGHVFELRGGFWFGGQSPATGVDEGASPALVFRLYRGPNPVRFRSRIAFDLPSAARVGVAIFDVAGRAARRMDFGVLPAGHQEYDWRAVDDAGRPLASGVYYLRLDAGHDRATQKVVILR